MSLPDEVSTPAPTTATSVACPFCGILCDDLEIARTPQGLKVVKNSCGRAVAGFERSVAGASATIRGAPATTEEAIAEATRLIRAARLPLYGGLGTEVDGMRAVMSLADRTRGVVDHALSEGQYRNFRVLQTSGWFMTTLTEARNRADLFVVVGTDIARLHSRFYERVVTNPKSMFADPAPTRDIVLLGKDLDTSQLKGPRIGTVTTLPCPIDEVGEVVAALRAIVNGKPLSVETAGGVPIADIRAVAARIQAATYPVFVWAPPALAFPNADLVVHGVSELVKDLNKTIRAAGLSLGGNEGAVSAGAVCAWQSGYPLRVSYQSGKPEHDMLRYSISRMVAAGEGDCLVWISSFTVDLGPPATKMPLIVLGTPGVRAASPPDVFIPVGTPGVDHAGYIVRCDNVVSLPLRDLGRSALPPVASVLGAIEAAL